jgi:hypothetical protein
MVVLSTMYQPVFILLHKKDVLWEDYVHLSVCDPFTL